MVTVILKQYVYIYIKVRLIQKLQLIYMFHCIIFTSMVEKRVLDWFKMNSMLVPTPARVDRSSVGMLYLKVLNANEGFSCYLSIES